jgi:hypothetical protein
MIAALFVSSLDPYLGLAMGIAVVIVAFVLLLADRTTDRQSPKRQVPSDISWNEEDPADLDRRSDG